MRFLVDECTGPAVARWLRTLGHDVFSVYDDARGISDDEVLARAVADDRVLISNDKDFGERVFRAGKPHKGVILLRLADMRASSKIAALERLFSGHANQLLGRFVVVSERTVRFVGA